VPLHVEQLLLRNNDFVSSDLISDAFIEFNIKGSQIQYICTKHRQIISQEEED
jgi:hypothetical protein